MAYPSLFDETNSWRGFRAEFAAAVADIKRAGNGLLRLSDTYFPRSAESVREGQRRAAELRSVDPYTSSGVDCEIVVAEAGGDSQAVYSLYRLSRAREEGLRAVARELDFGSEVEGLIAAARDEIGARPVLSSFGARSVVALS